MIPILELIRLEEDEHWGTIGVLKINKKVICFTLEPPDRLNERRRSSIPAQQYLIRRFRSPRFGETFRLENVPGRNNIEFHPGNTLQDTEGCILLGAEIGILKGAHAVLESKKAFNIFMAHLQGYDRAHLTIKEVY